MLGWRDDRPLADVLPAEAVKTLRKSFKFSTCGDLLAHYPRTYLRGSTDVGAGGAIEGEYVTVTASVVNVTQSETRTGKRVINVALDNGFQAAFFGQMWVFRVLRPGARVIIAGKLKFFRHTPQLQNPKFMLLGKDAKKVQGTKEFRELAMFGSLAELLADRPWIPIYPATEKVSSWFLLGAIHQVLESLPEIPEPLDYEVPLSYDQALRQVHEPPFEGPYMAIHRLKYNEALTVGLVMALRRRDALGHVAPALPPREDGLRAALLSSLPFELTQGQRDVLGDISHDISQVFPMQRLLQGEVGSGKTMVALLAMLQAADCGYQSALLAPTEVLASQHFASISAQAPAGVNVVLLTGSMKTAAKRQALLDIVSGEADIVIGTHAIIQDTVEFYDLGLVVVDEQHRFGVEQRDTLRGKAQQYPHMLVMTATPIPRTIAMTVFGDLSVSTLRELPGGRKPIQSFVVPESNEAWVARGWARIREEVAKGHQAYIVAPRIEDTGGVKELMEELEFGPLQGLRLAMLHGKMSDKDEVMAAFARGEYDVLVATTVIEVGVDVPNATIMLIRESENFGVSQLHQLRGRVGRGGNASLCLFHTLAAPGSASFQRVNAIAQTSSGFDLAELDLANRKEGDILGTLQSGEHRTLRLLNLLTDGETISRASFDATGLVARNEPLARELVAELTEDEQAYLDKS